MALGTVVHDSFLSNLARNNAFWSDGNFIALLIDTSLGGLSESDATIDQIITAGAVEVTAAGYARQTFTSSVFTDDGTNHLTAAQADPISFGSPDAGSNYDTLVIAANTGDDTTAWLALSFDVSDSGAARTTDGNPINITSDSHGYWILQAA